jgi:hypothetical protein
VDLLAHPFRLGPSGAAVTVEDDTDDSYAQGIAVLVLTRRGERVLVPRFGITDPLFDRVALADLNVALKDYGPEVKVVDVATTALSDTVERVALTFTGPQE